MRKGLFILALALALMCILLLFNRQAPPPNRPPSTTVVATPAREPLSPQIPQEPTPTAQRSGEVHDAESAIPPASSAASPLAATPATPSASEPPAHPGLAPEIAVKSIGSTLREYGNRFDGNPVGTNAEITKALDGGNAKSVKFLRDEQRHLNGKGELLDPWGTPYFFHQLSAKDTEVRSAGPDHRMWTDDDLLAR